eukprot:jgi/Chlat1/9103/Chrsp97S09274
MAAAAAAAAQGRGRRKGEVKKEKRRKKHVADEENGRAAVQEHAYEEDEQAGPPPSPPPHAGGVSDDAQENGDHEVNEVEDEPKEDAFQLFSSPSKKRKKEDSFKHRPAPPVDEDRLREPADGAELDQGADQAVAVEDVSNSNGVASSFRDLGVAEWLCDTCRAMGMRKPTPVQFT